MEDITTSAQPGLAESEVDVSALFKRQPPPPPVLSSAETASEIVMPKAEAESHDPENITFSLELVPDEQAAQVGADMEFNIVSDVATPVDYVNKELNAEKSTDIVMTDEEHSRSFMEDDQLSPCTVDTPVLEETSVELPVVPSYVELTEKQQKDIRKLAIKRIIDSYKLLRGAEFMQTRMALLSRLVAQVGVEFNYFSCCPIGKTVIISNVVYYLLLRVSDGCLFIMYDSFVNENMASFICQIIYLLFKIINV